MEKLIDAVVTAVCVLAVTAGGQKVLKESFLWVRKAALTKAARGIPPLPSFTNQTRKKK